MAKYHIIAEKILKNILTGEFHRGDRIPSEKDLAKEFDSSVLTVNKAISILVSNGCLVRRPGLGAFVAGDLDLEKIKNGRQFTVGIVVDSGIASIAQADRVLGRIAFNLQNLLSREGFAWSIISAHDGMDFRDRLDSVDGFITVGDVEDELVAAVAERRLPCVTFNRDRTASGLGGVLIDPQAIHLLVDQMAAAGHRRFLYVTNESAKQVYELRFGEYRAALDRHGLGCRRLVICADDLASGRLSPEHLRVLEDADFAFLPNDSLAISFLRFLEANGLAVPGRIGLCGYDNSIAGRQCSVPLTTIAYDILEACAALVRSLKEMLFRQSGGKIVLVDSWLILRESTARSVAERGRTV